MSAWQTVILILLLTHLVTAGLMISRVIKTPVLTLAQKRINSFLIIVFPFFWTVLMYYLLKNEPQSYEEEVKNTSHGFHESQKGFYP
jgi:hypothetical protein